MLRTRGTITDDVEHVAGGKTFFWAGDYSDNLNERETLRHRPQRLRDVRAQALARPPRTATSSSWPTSSPTSSTACASSARGARFVAMDSMNLWIDIASDSLVQVIRDRRLPDPQRRGARAADRAADAAGGGAQEMLTGARGRRRQAGQVRRRALLRATTSSPCRPTRWRRSSTRPARATRSPAASSATSPRSRDERDRPRAARAARWPTARRWPRSTSRSSAPSASRA